MNKNNKLLFLKNTTSRFFQFCFIIGPGEVAIGCFIFNQLVPIFLITNNNENCLIDPAKSSFYFNKVSSVGPYTVMEVLIKVTKLEAEIINIYHAAFLV
ncbi:hypothetical protein T06_13225 [Trichinella sp. T6]|nr:hypothetical protein T06_13225 [Trichinella sp. T6]